ncbi:MAG: hypothetical protein ACMG6E_00060 [Candidatus Roizmanbacteria bacterium]
MNTRKHEELIREIQDNFLGYVTSDAKFTILTIKNLIESNSRVEDSINELHNSINNSSTQNEKLQKRIYYLTIVAVVLTLVQALAVVVQLFGK